MQPKLQAVLIETIKITEFVILHNEIIKKRDLPIDKTVSATKSPNIVLQQETATIALPNKKLAKAAIVVKAH